MEDGTCRDLLDVVRDDFWDDTDLMRGALAAYMDMAQAPDTSRGACAFTAAQRIVTGVQQGSIVPDIFHSAVMAEVAQLRKAVFDGTVCTHTFASRPSAGFNPVFSQDPLLASVRDMVEEAEAMKAHICTHPNISVSSDMAGMSTEEERVFVMRMLFGHFLRPPFCPARAEQTRATLSLFEEALAEHIMMLGDEDRAASDCTALKDWMSALMSDENTPMHMFKYNHRESRGETCRWCGRPKGELLWMKADKATWLCVTSWMSSRFGVALSSFQALPTKLMRCLGFISVKYHSTIPYWIVQMDTELEAHLRKESVAKDTELVVRPCERDCHATSSTDLLAPEHRSPLS